MISANTDDDVAVQEALANWVTFTSESEFLESLETATMYLDALSDGHAYKDCEDTVAFKAAISK